MRRSTREIPRVTDHQKGYSSLSFSGCSCYCTLTVVEPLTVPEVALIVALPEVTPVATPAAPTVAIALSLDVH
jgi:hypothetical protein